RAAARVAGRVSETGRRGARSLPDSTLGGVARALDRAATVGLGVALCAQARRAHGRAARAGRVWHRDVLYDVQPEAYRPAPPASVHDAVVLLDGRRSSVRAPREEARRGAW